MKCNNSSNPSNDTVSAPDVTTWWNSYTPTALGLFQKLSSGGGGPLFFFSDSSTPKTRMESEPPRPPGHVSAFINPPPLWIKYDLIPRTSNPPPLHPSDTLLTKRPPHRTKKCLLPPRIISGTALTCLLNGQSRFSAWECLKEVEVNQS